jgi:uncharacterized protein (DUF2062 family)
MLKQHYKKFQHSKYIAKFSKLVGAKNLWVFNRASVEKAIALGIACAWIPLPFHTTIAVFLAVLIDCNILLVITAIWFANPITMPFMYYCAYKLGVQLLHVNPDLVRFHFTIESMMQDLHLIWQPFLLGCAVLGIASGLLTYLLLHFAWPDISQKIKR